MPGRRFRIEPPVGGLVRSTAFQSQPPFTTPYCQNIWPDSSQAQRRVIGTRDGVVNVFNERLQSGNYPINMLATLETNDTTLTSTYWEQRAWNVGLTSHFSSGSGGLVEPKTDAENKWFYADYAASNNTAGCFRQTETSWSLSNDFTFALVAVPYGGSHQATYTIYFDLDNTSPAPTTQSVAVSVALATSAGTDTYAATVTQYTASTPTSKASQSGTMTNYGHDTRLIRVRWNNSTTDVSVFVDDVEVVTAAQCSAITLAGGKRCGWSMTPTASGNKAIVESVSLSYTTTSAFTDTRSTEIVGCGGTVYRAPVTGRTGYTAFSGAVAGPTTIVDDQPVFAAQRQGLLYIADHGDILVDSTSVEVFTTSGGAPYNFRIQNISSTTGVTPGNFVVEVYASNNTTILPLGTYSIASVPSGTSLLMLNEFTSTPGASGAGITASIRIRRGIKYATLSTLLLAEIQKPTSDRVDVGTKGTPPVGCHLICEYRDRLVLAGNPAQMWFMSRRGDFNDWNYGADSADPGKAIYGNTTEAGQVPNAITALIPFRDDYLLISTADEVYRMRGDPAYGGDLLPISISAGVVGPQAWCVDDWSNLYFVSRNGLYRMVGGGQGIPEPLSRSKLPRELQNLNPEEHKVQMAYDSERGCVFIFLSAKSGTMVNFHWRYDIATESFWPFTMPTVREPYVVAQLFGTVLPKRCVGLGGQSGLIQTFSRLHRTDFGGAIATQLIIGPIRGGISMEADGILGEVCVNMQTGSEAATLGVYTGNMPSEAIPNVNTYSSASKFSHTLSAGYNTGIYPRIRGGALSVGLSATGGRWAIEEAEAVMSPGGRLRK